MVRDLKDQLETLGDLKEQISALEAELAHCRTLLSGRTMSCELCNRTSDENARLKEALSRAGTGDFARKLFADCLIQRVVDAAQEYEAIAISPDTMDDFKGSAKHIAEALWIVSDEMSRFCSRLGIDV